MQGNDEANPSESMSNALQNAQADTIKTECETGKAGGGTDTYTGYAPLPAVSLKAVLPADGNTPDAKKTEYSYGVSKNGVPHENSVNAQKSIEKYGALAIDLKSTDKPIYLTFDCGYENGYTPKILDALKEKNVSATFFITLDYAKSAPEIVARMIKEGHIVGNHTAKHPSFPEISRERMAQEIELLENELRTKFGYSAPFFRFPKGEYSENALQAVQSMGYRSIFWSVSYADWDPKVIRGKEYATEKITERLHPGAVILMHAVSPDNAAAMGDIIDKAREMGYTFKSLSQAKF